MIIGFDFDRVLFKTDEFKDFLDREIEGFLEEYPEEGNYDPEKHAERLGIDVEEIYSALEKAEDFLYPDTGKLEELRDDFKIVVVSRGDPYFQEKKIEYSGVLEHVDGFFIVEDGRKDQINIDFLVDDWEKEVERVDVPGYLMDRSGEDLEKVIDFLREEFG